jgi:hypothetical protein
MAEQRATPIAGRPTPKLKIQSRSDMLDAVEHICAVRQQIRDYKQEHPEARSGHYPTIPGSLLNAYNEGDLTFDEAVAAIEKMIQDRLDASV